MTHEIGQYVKETKMRNAEGTEFEVFHYADGDVMIRQDGTRDMVFIPANMYAGFMQAMERPSVATN